MYYYTNKYAKIEVFKKLSQIYYLHTYKNDYIYNRHGFMNFTIAKFYNEMLIKDRQMLLRQSLDFSENRTIDMKTGPSYALEQLSFKPGTRTVNLFFKENNFHFYTLNYVIFIFDFNEVQ